MKENKTKKEKFQRYKRGRIVLVDFTPSLGSELRGKHFAIVLTKKDTPNSSVLTVVPLSSKEKSYYLDVGNIVEKQILPLLIKYVNDFAVTIQAIDELNEEELNKQQDEILQVSKNLTEFRKICDMYISKNKRSYAMVQNISTISKKRIQKTVNKYDPMKNLIADDLILDLIDSKLIELFINKIDKK